MNDTQDSQLSSPLLSLERAEPSSPPSPSCPVFLSETSDSSRFAEALMDIKSIMCIPPRLLQPVFTAPRWLQPLVVPFTADRVERLRRHRAGERANCCYSNTLHGEFMRAGVCVATCCCSVTEVHRRAAVFKTWLCLESLWVVLSVYDRMVICSAAL